MKKINIIGCGLMGSQIAGLFSIMGYEVNIWNRNKINHNHLLRQKKIILNPKKNLLLFSINDNNYRRTYVATNIAKNAVFKNFICGLTSGRPGGR